jgi:hypothetical protein
MKQKHFYSHLVQINDIVLDLGELNMTQEERLHLLSLIEANVHNTVIDTVLTELSIPQKKIFLSNLLENNHDKTWKHIWENSNEIEQKITKSVENLLSEIRKDIKRTKKLK